MKQFFENLLIKLIAVAVVLLIGAWTIIVGAIGILFSVVVLMTLNLNDSSTSPLTKYSEKLLDVLVWPYKKIGVCDSWRSYVDWVSEL